MTGSRALACSLGLVLSLLAGCGGGGGGGGGSASNGAAGSSAGSSSGTQLAPKKRKPATTYVVDREGEGFLEMNDGKMFCHVKGTPREMGEQYGALMGDRIESLMVRMPAFIASQQFPSWVTQAIPTLSTTVVTAFDQLNRYPSDVKEYAEGVVAGNRRRRPSSFLIRDDVLFLSTLVDLGGITNGIVTCSTVAVWGPIAKDGKCFQTRCVDLFIGSGIEDNACCVIEKRDGKVPWANAGWAGMIGSASGMNAHGVATGQVWAFSDDKWFGEPWVLTTRRIMENAASSDDAVQAFRNVPGGWRTYGSNFVFGDRGDARGGVPQAYAIESSAQYMAVFHDNDPAEDAALVPGTSDCYAIKIPYAVFRGDFPMDPGMRSRSTGAGGPHGDPRGANSYQRRYKGQSDRVLAYVNAGTPIGADELIELTRGVATPGGSLQCCVYANTDLELWVADSKRTPQGNVDAFQQAAYTHYDFDFYLPTIDASLDRASYRSGETQTITLATSSLGSDRDLEVFFLLEGPGGQNFQHANAGARFPLAFRRGASGATTYLLDLPPGMPAGQYTLNATLYERGTSDVVDVSLVKFDVN